MKIYGIAIVSHECYGHGDFGDETQIRRLGAYGSGKFPPFFLKREDAEKYLKSVDSFDRRTIVEVDLK